jgi:hypothetical protein
VRVILVNPFDETVKEAVYGGDYREIYDLIGCSTFTVQMIDEDNDLFLDDEGLLVYQGNQRYFEYKGLGTFAGKGLIMAHDDKGESTATTLDLMKVSSLIEFKPKGYVEEPYMEFKALL